MSDRIALELSDVTMNFGQVAALTGASLRVRQGTIHALLGENGAGKTTLMRIAFGILKPDSGSILIDGVIHHLESPAEAIVAGVGMVQQHPQNVGAMSVWENILLGGKGRLNRRQARERITALAGEIGFRLDPDARAADLPVAAQQRLDILKAMDRRARILILDEPTAILAPAEARDLYAWLRKFASEGGTVVVITHKLEEARAYTDDLTVLRQGRTVLATASGEVSAGDLTLAMIGTGLDVPDQLVGKSAAGEPVATARNVTVAGARGTTAIDSASFDIHAGEIVGVAGVEGSGHHELLLALGGRRAIAGGTLTVRGDVGIVPEDRHRDAMVEHFTLSENVAIAGAGARRGSLDWKHASAQVGKLIAAFDIRAAEGNAPMSSLSGGNQQKLILARELGARPALLVAENPTRGLDVKAAAFVRDRLMAARTSGMAVVLYTTDLDELVGLADRVLVVHSGRVVETVRERSKIGAAMLGAS